jgi:hypothetical protein
MEMVKELQCGLVDWNRSLRGTLGELRPVVATRLNLYPRPWSPDGEVELNLFNKLGPSICTLLPGREL